MTARWIRMLAIAGIGLLAACGAAQEGGEAAARAELERLMPAALGGHQLIRQTFDDSGVEQMLAAVGAGPADLTVANAGSPEAGISIIAYKVAGASGQEIVDAFRQQAAYEEVSIAGKRVLKFAAGGGSHLYAADSVAFQLHADGDAVLEEALSKLP